MTLEQAMELVLDLAVVGVLKEGQAISEELQEERERQLEAIDTMKEFCAKHIVGDLCGEHIGGEIA